jgi:hypothetical protein
MPGAQQIGANIFTAAQQIARGFFLLAGNVDHDQRPSAVEDGELAGISPIGFDPVASAPRDQGRGDHLARYDPFTVVLDFGHSYRKLATLLRGRYLELGLRGGHDTINPFAFESTPEHLHFLHASACCWRATTTIG